MESETRRSRIWLVDDSPLEAEISRTALAREFDVEVFHEPGGMLERFANGERPDTIIVDWYMPDISGVDVCSYVRQSFNTAELPILVLTATGTQEDLLVGLAAGANDFVTKPCLDAELTARVKTLAGAARLHHRLLRAEESLREEAALREKFIAILAHDLRQPLHVFTMGSGILARGAAPDGPTAPVAKRFANAAARMQRMLDELLDFTRSRGKSGMPMVRSTADLAEVVRGVLSEIRHTNPEREITMKVEGDARGSWDSDRISQVVSNLVGNALEHSLARSSVHVTVRGEEKTVTIIVENEGHRIADDVLGTIFDPFRQAKPGRTGLGLGLYIVRAIARAHGGDVSVLSDDERTTFCVRLPRAPSSPISTR